MDVGTVQIDLDGLWVLLKFLGHDYGVADDPIYEQGLPRFLELLRRHGVRGTFFTIALDLDDPRKRRLLEQVVQEGHEIASHGLDHSYIAGLPADGKRLQIAESSARLRALAPVVGFRAPGYDMDAEALAVLEDYGYVYDSSAFPTVVTPLLSMAQRFLAGRAQTSYSWRAVAGPREPYQPSRGHLYRRGTMRLTEVPVTVTPGLRLPLNFSYATLLGPSYITAGLRWAMRSGLVNYLFHLIDFADPIDDPRFRRVPGVRVPLRDRLALADRVLRVMRDRLDVVPTRELLARWPSPRMAEPS